MGEGCEGAICSMHGWTWMDGWMDHGWMGQDATSSFVPREMAESAMKAEQLTHTFLQASFPFGVHGVSGWAWRRGGGWSSWYRGMIFAMESV